MTAKEVQDNPDVLFVSSGRSGGVGDVVKNQGESLKQAGFSLEYFIIKSGLFGYLAAIPRLRRKFKSGDYNIVHAHYSYSGIVATLAGCRPLVVSFMGSDICTSRPVKLALRRLALKRWDAVIVKTREMKESLNIPEVHIIPNGVDMERFKPLSPDNARLQLQLNREKKLVILIAGKNREEKNVALAYEAIKFLNKENIDFRHIHDVSNSEIPYWLNAANLLLLTSKREGSVNVVKEALACNCPVVSTDVGDVRELTDGIKGCFITSFSPLDIANKIVEALAYGKRIKGRERIADRKLDSGSVAAQISAIYQKVMFDRS